MDVEEHGDGLTKEELQGSEELKDIIISEMLREPIFLVFGLELLQYEIIFTSKMPIDVAAFTYENRIVINPNDKMFDILINKQGFMRKEVMTALLYHEVCHPLFYHKRRCKNRDSFLWNVAADYMINLLGHNLEVERNLSTNRKAVVVMKMQQIPKDLLMFDFKYENMLEEEIYDDLVKNSKTKTEKSYIPYNQFKDFMDGNSDTPPQPSKEPQSKSEPQVEITKTEITVNGKKYKSTDINFPDIPPATKEEKEEGRERELQIDIARKMLESSMSKGAVSERFKKYLDKMFEVTIDIERLVRDSVMTALEKSQDMAFSTPRGAWLANPFMPYLPTIYEEEVLGTVIFAIDESGSMSDDNVRKGIYATIKCRDRYKALYVIKHDTLIHWEHEYKDDLTQKDVDGLLTRRHSGGTSHKDVFKRVVEYMKSGEDKEVSLFVGVTDLASDILKCQSILPYSIPRVWLVNGTYKVPGLVGRVIRVNK